MISYDLSWGSSSTNTYLTTSELTTGSTIWINETNSLFNKNKWEYNNTEPYPLPEPVVWPNPVIVNEELKRIEALEAEIKALRKELEEKDVIDEVVDKFIEKEKKKKKIKVKSKKEDENDFLEELRKL